MSAALFLTLWLVAGIACFALARSAWQLQFGCKPVTIGTALGALVAMWAPPVTLLMAIMWACLWLFEGKGKSTYVASVLDTVIFNPCRSETMIGHFGPKDHREPDLNHLTESK